MEVQITGVAAGTGCEVLVTGPGGQDLESRSQARAAFWAWLLRALLG